ncbi:MAG: 3-isopropylmalate dehydrogenase [Lachnospiraceae bacterium]|nr:3-isopropylmalate dehydrogenase [Lachnospiraceae bacterium]
MEGDRKGEYLQWHPAFYAGMQIELKQEAENLIFENEHQLGTKPLGIDIIIIKKDADIPIRKNIGRIFRKYNIVEYKGPKDYFSIDDFYKVYGYASLYKANAKHENEIKTSEVTITFISRHYPYKLEKYLIKHRHYRFVKSGEGIYQIVGNDFTMQFIVTSRVSKEENLWIWGINNPVDGVMAEKLVKEYRKNKSSRHYESVMDIIVRANEKIFGRNKKMCKAMEEIMEDRIVEREQKARVEARTKARAEDILVLLKECGNIPAKLRKLILGESDMAVLERWLKIAGKVNSIEEFQNAI